MHPHGTRIYSLSIHADYRCRHAGACCTSGWPIPVERPTAERLTGLIRTGRLVMPTRTTGARHSAAPVPFIPVAEAPADTPVVAAVRGDGACAFYEADTGLCAIHRQAGASLLPVACQQFPRVSLLDGRGLFVTVSHYCPTAARLVFRDDVALGIVEAPAGFQGDFDYDPLDARDALPPLLSPQVLLDAATFGRWEREVVGIFGRDDLGPEEALRLVAAFTEALRTWKPGGTDFSTHFDEARERTGLKSCSTPVGHMAQDERTGLKSCSTPVGHPAKNRFDPALVRRHYGLVLGAVPDALRPEVSVDAISGAWGEWVAPGWPRFAAPVRRYLAAKAFGSWLAYQGEGLRTIVHSLGVALSLLKASVSIECGKAGRPLGRDTFTAAIRRSDELLLHLASREDLARAFSAIEKVDGGLSSDVP
jgi:Fe-S-cluster containining protein